MGIIIGVKRRVYIFVLMMLGTVVWAQEEYVLRGRVTDGKHGVPYATLQLKNTSVGVSCNDAGEYELKVPAGRENDTVVIRSIGYETAFRPVQELLRKGQVKLKPQSVELREVKVKSYRKASQIVKDAVDSIGRNYHRKTSYPTFFYRDWRTLDGELYLYDEAVMNLKRTGYLQFSDKRVYRFEKGVRELENNYKSLLRHRLLVYDRNQLVEKITNRDGIEEMMGYDDNGTFFDPVATPQAAYMLARRIMRYHKFEPVREFMWDGELYFRLRSVGPGRFTNAKVHYEYLIRKRDLVIVRITSSLERLGQMAPQDAWVNTYYTWLTFDTDTSAWEYDFRDGRYTLTHYYNYRKFHLGSKNRGHNGETQYWQQCVDWTLTDFSFEPDTTEGDKLEVLPQALPGAFGASDYNADYWGRYNSIPIDTMPLRLLEEKYRRYAE